MSRPMVPAPTLGDVIELGALMTPTAQGVIGLLPAGRLGQEQHRPSRGGRWHGRLIKAILSVRHGEIAPHLLLNPARPGSTGLKPPCGYRHNWTPGRRPRASASRGQRLRLQRYQAHVIVEEVPSKQRPRQESAARYCCAVGTYACGTRHPGCDVGRRLEATPCSVADVGLTLANVAPSSPTDGLWWAPRRRNWRHDSATWPLPKVLRPRRPDPGKLEELARLWAEGGEIDWARLSRSSGARMTSLPGHPFQRQRYWPDPVVDEDRPPHTGAPPADPRPHQPVTAVARQRAGSLRAFIDERARRVLSDEPLEPLDPDLPLLEQGFTSLAAMELGKILERDLGTTVPSTFIFNYPTINSMAAFFTSESAQQSTAVLVESPPSEMAHPEYDYLDDLSEEDLEVLIDREVSVR